MWREIQMIGRDELLKKQIYPRCKEKKAPFLLVGGRGAGKSALLQWAFMHGKEPKALISASVTIRESLIEIAKGWGLQIVDGEKVVPLARAKVSDLEEVIMKQANGSLYVDDIHEAKPAFLRRFKVWRERFRVFACGIPPFKRDELKQALFGLKMIEVEPIQKQFRLELAERYCRHYGSVKSPLEIAQTSAGFPSLVAGMAQGTVEIKAHRVKSQELDLSPIFILGLGGLVTLRYVGVGMNDSALYLLGGLGLGFVAFWRFVLVRGGRS